MGAAPSTDAPKRPPPKISTTKQSPVWSPGGSRPPAAKRRPALIAIGAALTLVALGFGSVFAFNLQQYTTVDARFAGEPAGAAKASAIRAARATDLRRLFVYGPASAIAGVPGIVLLVLGLRKR